MNGVELPNYGEDLVEILRRNQDVITDRRLLRVLD